MSFSDSLYKLSELGKDVMLLENIGGGSTLSIIGFSIICLFLVISYLLDNSNVLYFAKDAYEDIQFLLKSKDVKLKNDNKNFNLNDNNINEEIKEIDESIQYKINNLKKNNIKAYYLLRAQMSLKFISLRYIYYNINNILKSFLCLGILFLLSGVIIGMINETNMDSKYKENLNMLSKTKESINEFEIFNIVPYLDDSTSNGVVTYLITIKNEDRYETLKYSGDVKVSESNTNSAYILNKDDYEKIKEELDIDYLLNNTINDNDFIVDIEVTDELFKNLNSIPMIIK